KRQALRRAYTWYQRAEPRLTGLSKTRADRAMDRLEKELGLPVPFKAYAGKWAVTYGNRSTREYLIDADGNVTQPDEDDRRAKLRWRGADLLLDFGDGKLERLKLTGGRLRVEHFNPAGTYPRGRPDTVGTGVRKP